MPIADTRDVIQQARELLREGRATAADQLLAGHDLALHDQAEAAKLAQPVKEPKTQAELADALLEGILARLGNPHALCALHAELRAMAAKP